MDGPDWRDCRLTDVIEAQQFLLLSLIMALEAGCGLSPRGFGRTVRRAAEENVLLRAGVKTVVARMSGALEAPPAAKPERQEAPRWKPRILDGGRSEGHPDPRRDGRTWAPEVIEGGKRDKD